MNKGTKAILTCPPEIAYGSRAMGKIPANATLKFEVELIDFYLPLTFKVETLSEGEGELIAKGKEIDVWYRGRNARTGVEFDSNLEKGKPLKVKVGEG